MDKIDVADYLMNKGLNIRVPHTDGVVVGCSEEQNKTLMEGHA